MKELQQLLVAEQQKTARFRVLAAASTLKEQEQQSASLASSTGPDTEGELAQADGTPAAPSSSSSDHPGDAKASSTCESDSGSSVCGGLLRTQIHWWQHAVGLSLTAATVAAYVQWEQAAFGLAR